MTADDYPEWLPWQVVQAFDILFFRDRMNANIHGARLRLSPATLHLGRWLMAQYGPATLTEDDPYFGRLECLDTAWTLVLRHEWQIQGAGVELPSGWVADEVAL